MCQNGSSRDYVQNLLSLGQIGSKREACDGGAVGALLQRIDGIVDIVEIGYALGRVKSINGRIDQVGKTQKLRLHLRQDEGPQLVCTQQGGNEARWVQLR